MSSYDKFFEVNGMNKIMEYVKQFNTQVQTGEIELPTEEELERQEDEAADAYDQFHAND